MRGSKYRAVITEHRGDHFKYEVTLHCGITRVGHSYANTRWGARRWAHKMARKHDRQRPYREEIAIR